MATNYPSSEQDFSDVSAGQDITASNHNTIQDTIEALQTKLGLTALASLSETAGHFSLPTSAGEPTGNPANGAGSMVWDNTNNKLYVNEDGSDSTWEEIGGGAGPDFTDPVNIDISGVDAYALDLTNPSEAKMIRMGGGVTMTYGGGVFTTSLVSGGGFIKSYIPAWSSYVAQEIGLYYNDGFKLSSSVDFTVAGGVSSLTANDTTDPALHVINEAASGTALKVTVPNLSSGTSDILDVAYAGTGTWGSITFNTNTYSDGSRNPAFTFSQTDDENPRFQMNWQGGTGDLVDFKPQYNTEHYYSFACRATDGLYIGMKLLTSGDEWKLGPRRSDTTNLTLHAGTDKVFSVGYTAGAAFALERPLTRGTISGITASTTQTQGQGALTTDVNEISTVATTNDTVTLRSAAAGSYQCVINNGANTLQIFPASSDDLGAGTNTAVTLAAGGKALFLAYTDVKWQQLI
jgi:hypothetical protein